jgi:hypothetical protein
MGYQSTVQVIQRGGKNRRVAQTSFYDVCDQVHGWQLAAPFTMRHSFQQCRGSCPPMRDAGLR